MCGGGDGDEGPGSDVGSLTKQQFLAGSQCATRQKGAQHRRNLENFPGLGAINKRGGTEEGKEEEKYTTQSQKPSPFG